MCPFELQTCFTAVNAFFLLTSPFKMGLSILYLANRCILEEDNYFLFDRVTDGKEFCLRINHTEFHPHLI